MATVTEPCIELAVVEKMTSDLCNALPIDDLFPSMISNRVIDFNDKADIRAERTERRRVEYFLDKYLTKGLNLDTTRFYRFLKVLEGSPKCDFLVTRIKRCMEECKEELDKSTGKGQPLAPSAPPPVTTAAGTIINATASATVSGGRHVTTPPANVPVNTISGESCLATGKDSKTCMRLMHKYVIPNISEEWEAVATFLDYSIQAKNNIKKTYRTSRECCTALLENWLTTNNGVKPKTWKKLVEVLSEVDELEEVIGEIKQGLISEGVSFDVVPVEDSHDYYDQEYYETNPQGAAAGVQFHYQYDQYTEGPTDPRWSQQPAPDQMWRNEQRFGLYNHPSYDPSSTHLDQYGRLVANNPVPPTDNRQPHAAGVDQYQMPMVDNQAAPTGHGLPHPGAFILYSKEENDPHGDQVLCLSNLLCNCGINCDIDLYHTNDISITDWAFWVGKSLEYHIASQYSYVILVCSPVMISTLEQRNDNARLEMVAGNIDRLTLRHYLQDGAHKVLPLFINNPSDEYVPPYLSGRTRYYFPYDKLDEMPENVSTQEVLNHPAFTSLRSLVATLTGQQENPPPDLGHVPPVGNSSNMTAGAAGKVRTHGPHTGNSPKLLRRDVDLPPSTIDQDAPPHDITTGSVIPQAVTPRTAEQQAHDMQHGGRVAGYHQPPPTGAYAHSKQLRTHGPHTGNSPKILRRDADLPPSTNDQDAPPYDNISESVKSQVPQDVVLRTVEQNQIQYSYGRQVVLQAPVPNVHSRQSTGRHTTMVPQEETGGVKRDREPSSDDDSCYGTPTDSPRDHSLGTLDSAHYPVEATPSSLQPNDNMNTNEMGQVTTCTDQEHSNYHNFIALPRQNK